LAVLGFELTVLHLPLEPQHQPKVMTFEWSWDLNPSLLISKPNQGKLHFINKEALTCLGKSGQFRMVAIEEKSVINSSYTK
jgi:hypothetical protein